MSDNTPTMIQQLIDQSAAPGPQPAQDCPDGGSCTHRCGDLCWRSTWCEPLSAHGDTWPRDRRPRPRS